jgi:hypothetical protein
VKPRRGALLALLPVMLGCTLDAGHGFATIESARLSVEFEPGIARDLAGATLTDLGYVVSLDRLTLHASELVLLELDIGAAQSFDPANPPPGYTLCHGGHCHAADGRLVDYAEVELELAGRSAGLKQLATVPVGQDLDLLAGADVRLTRVEPSRELPQATISEIGLVIAGFSGVGRVSGGGLLEPVPLTIELVLRATLEGSTRIAISRDGPETLRLTAALALDGTLFDGIEFAGLAGEDGIVLSDLDLPAAATLAGSVLGTELEITRDGQ